jgi:hypothetical protein
MCDNKVEVHVTFAGKDIEMTINCGDIYADGGRTETALCPECLAKAEARYPQGWRYRPGDICKHGVYVGGERDCACWRCETEP